MQVKKCHICKQDKEVSMFYKDKTRKDGYSSRCKECDKAICRNKNHKNYRSNYQKRYLQSKLKIFKLLKNKLKCCLCPESNSECLDFHHIDSNKHEYLKRNKSIYKFITKFSPKNIIEELNKCICICANCHRKIHSDKIILSEEQKKDFKINLPENLFDTNKLDKDSNKETDIDNITIYFTFGGCGDNMDNQICLP